MIRRSSKLPSYLTQAEVRARRVYAEQMLGLRKAESRHLFSFSIFCSIDRRFAMISCFLAERQRFPRDASRSAR